MTRDTCYCIQEMSPSDASEVVALMRCIPEVCFCEWEDEHILRRGLMLQSTIGFVARELGDDHMDQPGRMVAAVLGGTIGLRSTINHLAVDPNFRRMGIGRALADHILAALRRTGIRRTFLFVIEDAENAFEFWSSLGFRSVPGEKALEQDLQ
jgi:ribosomal protein S18 acetylase RimI-like enzyme